MKDTDRLEAGPGEVLIRVAAAGVNFIDVYHRTGLYPTTPPFTPGQEVSGVIEALGSGVTGLTEGQRVATAQLSGGYAEFAVAKADKVVPVPDAVSDVQGAAAMLQGMTAHYLARSIRPLQPGMTCLVHAAAGGVGLLLCQMARMAGARVIGTVSTVEKAALAREAGADEIILYARDNVLDRVMELTGGTGVEIVFDAVGKTTFEQSLASLKPRGMMVSYGNASGPAPAVEPLALSRGGSLFLTRPTLGHYIATREELLQRAGEVLGWVAAGDLKLRIHKKYALAEAAQAHRDLESRQTSGKLLLIP